MSKLRESLGASLGLKVASLTGRLRGTAKEIYLAIQEVRENVRYGDGIYSRKVIYVKRRIENYNGKYREHLETLLNHVNEERAHFVGYGNSGN